MLLLSIITLALGAQHALATAGIAETPPMGFNTWNYWDVNVNATILIKTAEALKETGLAAKGYEYVNSDDAWMLATRGDDGFGPQIPNPSKFPQGMEAVVKAVNDQGLKLGLYTARASHTCAGFAASCLHELIDVEEWMRWGVEYMKDDSCGTCGDTVEADYWRMQQSINAGMHYLNLTHRPMVLSIEGQPDITVVSSGAYGNMRRVGHDIQSNWLSMVSLVDIGSGLWPYAHNGSIPGVAGSFWNDLDMIEVGVSPGFNPSDGETFVLAAQAHFAQWCIMKAPLLVGLNFLAPVAPATLEIIGNTDALAINQDPLGLQGRRVATATPQNTSWLGPDNAVALLAPCDSGDAAQQWTYNDAQANLTQLLIAPCNASDPTQLWVGLTTSSSPNSSVFRNIGHTNQCVDGDASDGYTGRTTECKAGDAAQDWYLDSSNHIHLLNTAHCLDVFDFHGPNVFNGACKAGGDDDSNQVFQYDATTKLVHSDLPGDVCLSLGSMSGGILETTDADGNKWCLDGLGSGSTTLSPCDPTSTSQLYSFTPSPSKSGPQNYTISEASGKNTVGFNNQFGASGPLPHTRWVIGGSGEFTIDFSKPSSTIQSTSTNIIDDDNIGHVTTGGDFCLAGSRAGNLETWAGELSGGRWAVTLFNRAANADTIKVDFSTLPNVPTPPPSFEIKDIWANKSQGTFQSSYSAQVPPHAVAFLILTPSK